MKTKHTVLALALSGLLLLAGCTTPSRGVQEAASDPDSMHASAASDTDTQSAYHKITAEEAKKMMDEGGVTVVDVRTQAEYEASHIPGAVLVPNESIDSEEAPEALPDQDAVLLVHCRTGIRSKQASDKLVALGYTQVYDFGGIVDWPYETEGSQSK